MNFVSITFDDLNAFAFLKALYGSQLHTPNIDRVMATGAAGELRWEAFEGGIYVEGDVNGDALTDFAIRLDAVATISSSDFNL